jgi:hypothetical protein
LGAIAKAKRLIVEAAPDCAATPLIRIEPTSAVAAIIEAKPEPSLSSPAQRNGIDTAASG